MNSSKETAHAMQSGGLGRYVGAGAKYTKIPDILLLFINNPHTGNWR